MLVQQRQIPGGKNIEVSQLDLSGSLNTGSFPHLIDDSDFAQLDNAVFPRNGMVSKRPGSIKFGGNGVSGAGPSVAGTRFYFGQPKIGQLVTHNGTKLFTWNDGTGVKTQIDAAASGTTPSMFAKMFDPENGAAPGAASLFICDGSRIPQVWDGATFRAVSVAAGKLPQNGRTAVSITPRFCLAWKEHMVYAGDPVEPSGMWISDPFRPQSFTGNAYIDSSGNNYTAYFPGERDSDLGDITGLAQVGPFILVFFTGGVISGYNTGASGAFEYQWNKLSTSVGCPAPRSIVSFDVFVTWYSGDGFWATDGQGVYPLPNLVPTITEQDNQSFHPAEISNIATVAAARRGSMMLASYDSNVLGFNDRVIMFDFARGGGWSPYNPTGGRWARWPAGFRMAWGVECRGPGDKFQFFWGQSDVDQILQHDAGTYSDLDNTGAAIGIAINWRLKSFMLDKATMLKKVLSIWPIIALDPAAGVLNLSIIPYVATDLAQSQGNAIAEFLDEGGAKWGSVNWGSFQWTGQALDAVTSLQKGSMPDGTQGHVIGPGIIESSMSPINMIGMVMEVIFDEPTT